MAAAEAFEFDQEGAADDLSPSLDRVDLRRAAARGDHQVIVDEDPGPVEKSNRWNLQRIGSVLELILDRDRFRRKPTRLAGRNEADVQRLGQGPAEDEPAGFSGQQKVRLAGAAHSARSLTALRQAAASSRSR